MSETRLRGSLASGEADEWSDIDVAWAVPDAAFDEAVTAARNVLDRLAPIDSFRIDPDLARSDRRRLIYIRFAGVPLFWRVDLDVVARSVAGDESYDRGNPEARDTLGWSPAESALMNGVAALKAIYRGNWPLALELLQRGASRAGVSPPAQASPAEVASYAERIAARFPDVRALADELSTATRSHTADGEP